MPCKRVINEQRPPDGVPSRNVAPVTSVLAVGGVIAEGQETIGWNFHGVALGESEFVAIADGVAGSRGIRGEGENGAITLSRGQEIRTGIFQTKALKPTGAGDAFNGGFAVALAEGRDVVDAVRFGCATAGISVTRPGTAPAMPSRNEIDALLAR